MHRIRAPKKLHVGLLVLVLGALITGSSASAGRQVIPYLSHGVGVDQSLYSGTSTKTPLVIPYLSHGVGVDESLYVGGSHHLRRTAATAPVAKAVPDAFERAVARREAAESTAAVRPDDRSGTLGIGVVTAAGSTTAAVRPDDRSGTRGIGTAAAGTTVSVDSSSSTDWSPALYAGAGFVAAMLLAGSAFALSRRQHDRVAAH